MTTKPLVGYTDRLSVAPGQRIRFMVSCGFSSYRADIVRLIHGDEHPAGPGFKEHPVETNISGEYPARLQTISLGSYVRVPASPMLELTSFTLHAWIYPTTPAKGIQGLLTHGSWSDALSTGYGMFLGADGSLALWLADGHGNIQRISTGNPLQACHWYQVACCLDAEGGNVLVYQAPVDSLVMDSRVVTSCKIHALPKVSAAPFFMAAYSGEDGHTRGHFNGKIDRPRVFDRALTLHEIELLEREALAPTARTSLRADWDFSKDISSILVRDCHSFGLHGETVNMPARAVTGHNWTGAESNWIHAPTEYGAIHFHDDDLEDANWEVDFELEVPSDLKSGVYAARLHSQTAQDHVPFFVRPQSGRASAQIAFLAPTLTYVAYSNWPVGHNLPIGQEAPGIESAEDRYVAASGLLSTYNVHTDGSGVCYASRRRPLLSLRPRYRFWQLDCPWGLAADLHLIDWLEAKGFLYDVITDEDLHCEGVDLLARYRVVLTGSHPEYCTSNMMSAIHEYLQSGGRLMYLGGNGFYGVAGLHAERSHVLEIRRRSWKEEIWRAQPGEIFLSTTGELADTWELRRPRARELVGVDVVAAGLEQGQPYRREAGSFDAKVAFIFDGIQVEEEIGNFGLILGAAAGLEIDSLDYTRGTPRSALLLARASGFSGGYDLWGSGTAIQSDMVWIETPNDGRVFSVGSITWCASLSYNDYENNISRITENVLKRFSC